MKKQTVLLMLAFLLSLSGIAQKSALEVSITNQVVPAFIRNQDNNILCIKIKNPGDRELTVDAMALSLKGTDNLKDIKYLRLYATGASPDFRPDVIFGKTAEPAASVTFKGRQTLFPGNNYFWASVTLAPTAGLLNEIHISCENIKTVEKTTLATTSTVSPVRIGEAVRKRMDDQSNTYRIPGLVRTPKGTLLAVYDIRWKNSGDLQGDIDVGVSRSLDNGQTWLPMQKAIDMGEWGGLSNLENGIGDPAILVDEQTGRIWIAALWLHGKKGKAAWWASQPGLTPQETGQFILAYSDDEGATWSEPINITQQVKKPEWYLCFNGPGMGIMKKDGTLVFPAQFKDKDQVPHSTIVYSKDRGKTWHIGTGAKSKTTESQVVELADGSLMLNMRDDRGGSRSVAVTRDLGQTWEEHVSSRSALPEPVCQASIIRTTLKDGRQALAFFNPATTRGRHHMTLKLSFDDGKTWPEKYHTLLYEPGTYGYSCLTRIDPSTLGVLYEGAGDLYFQLIDLNKIVKE